MENIQDRIQLALNKKGLSWAKAATSIGLSPQAPSKWKKGQISRDNLEKLAVLTGVDLAWLISGNANNGIIVNGNNTVDKGSVQIGQQSNFIPLSTPVVEWDDNTVVDDDELEIDFYKDMGFACGTGLLAVDNITTRKLRMGRLTLKNLGIEQVNAFAAMAKDDSMTPYIQDGDTIFVDKGRTQIKDGRIFAIRFGDLYFCKRLYRMPDGSVRIVSDNSDEFPEMVATPENIKNGDFEVIGWIWSVSRLERW